MKTIVIRTKIRKNCLEQARQLFITLKNRQEEVLETLRNEGVFIESAFLDKHQDDYFLIYFLKAVNIEKAYEVFDNSRLPIDIYFKEQWNKYFEGRVILEELLDLECF